MNTFPAAWRQKGEGGGPRRAHAHGVSGALAGGRLTPPPPPRLQPSKHFWASHRQRLGWLALLLSSAPHPVGGDGSYAQALHRPLWLALQPSPLTAACCSRPLRAGGPRCIRAPGAQRALPCPALPCPPGGAGSSTSPHAWPRVQPADLPLGQSQPRRSRPARPAAR